jgi:hypothetical protein
MFEPWHELPPQIAPVLRPVLADVAAEMIEAVSTVPAYTRLLEGTFRQDVRAGVQEALQHFLAEIEAGGPVVRPDLYARLGQAEMRAGRTLESLLRAYRIGAQVAWRRFAVAGIGAGVEPDTLYLLAESIFAYSDVLSVESAEAYALEQSVAASEADLPRRRLVRMLVREPPEDPSAVEAAAREAGWSLPRTLAVVAISGDGRARAGSRLPPDSIYEAIGELICGIVPDPDAPLRGAAIERAVREAGVSAGLGTTVHWPDALVSFARARAALELADRSPGLVVAREAAVELLLHSNPLLARELAFDQLAPLAELTPHSRSRLKKTLRAWLDEEGRLSPAASRLAVHPHTVRYRVARLQELFGDALEDPEARFALELALRIDAQEHSPEDSRGDDAVRRLPPGVS